MKINVNVLRGFHACDHYMRAFVRTFPRQRYPDGVEVTVDTCVRYAGDFDWAWAAETLLTRVGYARFEDTIDTDPEHQRIEGQLRKAHGVYDRELDAWRQRYNYASTNEAQHEYQQVARRYNETLERLALERAKVEAKIFAQLSYDHESVKVALAFDGRDVNDLDSDLD